jgi:hypothetical protein
MLSRRMSLDQLVATVKTRRAAPLGAALLLAAIVPVGLWGFRGQAVLVQNPMGDDATAAVAATEPAGAAAPQTPAPAPAEVVAARVAFGSSASASAACLDRHQELLRTAAAAQRADSAAPRPGAGRDPVRAERFNWYPRMPAFRDGAILPCARIVAYYGHPNSTRMGVLGEYPKDEMLRRLREQVAEWERADPETPVVPALHMVAVVAQAEPGTAGHYRTITTDARVAEVHAWAQEAGGVFFVDIQTGTEELRALLPRFDWILKNPDVHLGVDPEFMMKDGSIPGRRIGTMDAEDINYAIDHLAALVKEHDLPPKVLVIHRFTSGMVTNTRAIRLRPEVQVVMHMDGHGRMQGPLFKYDTYASVVVAEPVQFAGWKNFYHHDNEKGVMPTPRDLMRLHPLPLYIQYQ